MKLRQKSKRDQALDAAASVAKTWSEWRLGEKVAKTATKATKKATKSAAKAAKKSKKSDAGKRKPMKIVGILALVGGIGAAVAKKLGGGKAEPLYTPPGPAADMAPPPPSPVADLGGTEQTTVPSTEEPALTASSEVPPRDPSQVVVEDLVDTPAVNEPVGSEEPAGAPSAEEDLAPEPEDLVSDTDDRAAADDDEPTEKPA